MDINKISLCELLNNYNDIIIPDIQRDYVMGSGREKLKTLFKAMAITCNDNKEFNFSCVTGYVDKQTKTFYVYDGQQRLVTLVYLCAYLYNKNRKKDENIERLLNKFSFTYREEANIYLEKLLLEQQDIKPNVVDFTTFSLQNLINTFQITEYFPSAFENLISFDFLFKNVNFELVLVEKTGDAEQFFMDLNDGLDLKEFEIFKAELNHKSNILLGSEFKKFAVSLDNRWLNFFLPFKTNEHCEEEIEIDFIKFCFRMMWIEEKGNDTEYDENNVEWIEKEHIEKIESIMNRVVNLDIINAELPTCVNYSFGELHWNKDIKDVTGVYWKLDDNSYNSMLKQFIKNVYDKRASKNDVLIWGYISNLNMEEEELYNYLRFIKKLLNNNRVKNNLAYYDDNNNMWFTKYSTYGIPNYYKIPKLNYACHLYGSSIQALSENCEKNEDYIFAVINFLNEKTEEAQNEDLNEVVTNEYQKRQSEMYSEIEKIENLPHFNGLVDNILDDDKMPMLSYDQLITKINGEVNDSQSIKNSIYNVYDKISNIVNSFEDIVEKNVMVKWKAYTGNYSKPNYEIQLLFQCLSDFFTDYRLKSIIQTWILDNYKEDNEYTQIKVYLKRFRDLSVGWLNRDYQICYPGDYYANDEYGYKTRRKGLLSIKGQTDCIIRTSIEDYFRKQFYEITLNQSNDINIYFEGNIVVKDKIPSNINDYIKWLRDDLLIGKKYNRIFYSDVQWYNDIVLQSYAKNNAGSIDKINTWASENKMVVLNVSVLEETEEYYFLSNNALKCFETR